MNFLDEKNKQTQVMHMNPALQEILKWCDTQRLKKSNSRQEGSGKRLFMRGIYGQKRRKNWHISLRKSVSFLFLREYKRNV